MKPSAMAIRVSKAPGRVRASQNVIAETLPPIATAASHVPWIGAMASATGKWASSSHASARSARARMAWSVSAAAGFILP